MTKPDNRKRISIPKDIQRGDVLVLSDGERQTVSKVYQGGDVATNYGNIYHGDGSRYRDNGPEFVVAIERKTKPKPTRDEKDAAWLSRVFDWKNARCDLERRMVVCLAPIQIGRIRAIARRLNGGKAVKP